MRAPNLILIAALGAAALGLTATTAATAKAPSGPPKACFYARNVRGFSAPTEDTVYLRVSGQDVYEAKLFADCTDIDWAQHIALRSRGSSWICSPIP